MSEGENAHHANEFQVQVADFCLPNSAASMILPFSYDRLRLSPLLSPFSSLQPWWRRVYPAPASMATLMQPASSAWPSSSE